MSPQGDMSTSADTGQQPTQADAPPIAQGPVADERQQHRSPSSHSAPQLFDSQMMHLESFDGIGNPAHESHPAEGTTQYGETEDLIINGQIDPHLPDHPAEQDPSNTCEADTANAVKSDIELFEEYLKDPDVETDEVFQTYHEAKDEEQTKGGGVAISTLGGTRRLVRRTSTSGSIGGSSRKGDPYGVPLIDYTSPCFPRSAANEGQDDADDDEEVTEVEEDKIPPVVASKRALKPFRTPAIVRSASLESTKRQGHEKRSYSSPPAKPSRSAPSWKTDNMPLVEPPSPSPLNSNAERQLGAATIAEEPDSIPAAQQASPVTREASVQQKSKVSAGAKADLPRPPTTTPAPEARRQTLAEHPIRRESPRVEQTPRTKMPAQYPGERQAAASPSVRHKPDARFEGIQPTSAHRPSETTARRFAPLSGFAEDHDMPSTGPADREQAVSNPPTRKRMQPETSSLHPRLLPPERRGRRRLQPHRMDPHVLSPVSERDAELGYSESSFPQARDVAYPNDVRRVANKRVHDYGRESSYHLPDDKMSMAPPVHREYRSFSRSTTAGRPELDAYAQNRAQAQDVAGTEISDEEPDQDVPFDPQAPVAKFDFHTELVEKWDVIQQRMSPVLQEFAEEVLLNTFEAIFTVAHVFHRLNEDTRSELEEGVRQIGAEEAKHEENKKAIEDFSAEIRRVSAMFRGFGNASREASLSRHG